MTGAPLIENGFATVGEGSWLVGRGQPAVALGTCAIGGVKGFLAPDRRVLHTVRTERKLWPHSCAILCPRAWAISSAADGGQGEPRAAPHRQVRRERPMSCIQMH